MAERRELRSQRRGQEISDRARSDQKSAEPYLIVSGSA